LTKYEIGRGRPPIHTRFKPGRSGNLAGRPKRPPSLRAELDRELAELTPIPGGKATKLRAILEALTNAAVAGNLRAIGVLLTVLAKTSEPGDEAAEQLSDRDREILEGLAEREPKSAEESRATPEHKEGATTSPSRAPASPSSRGRHPGREV
jgi:hypothetical protein